ncbi:hypothetical protein Tco_0052020 [Tanacetum coccineum]
MQNHIVGESQVTNVKLNGANSTIGVTNSYVEVRDINNIGHANGRCGKVLVGPRVNDPSQGNGIDKKFGIPTIEFRKVNIKKDITIKERKSTCHIGLSVIKMWKLESLIKLRSFASLSHVKESQGNYKQRAACHFP